MPAVSIVCPVYNSATYIHDTLRAVKQQTFDDFELIIVDDGSTDDTIARITDFSAQHTRIIAISHSGLPAVARNRGIAAATGTYLKFLDADDILMPSAIARQFAFMQSAPHVDICFTGCLRASYKSGAGARRPDNGLAEGVFSPADTMRALLRGNPFCTSTAFLRVRQANAHIIAFDENPRFYGTEDFDLWLRLMEHGSWFGYLRDPLLTYLERPHSVSHDRLRNLRGTLSVLEEAAKRAPDTYRDACNALDARLAYLHREIARLSIRRPVEALSHLREAAIRNPFDAKVLFLALVALSALAGTTARRILWESQ